jgi:hypothetical protein
MISDRGPQFTSHLMQGVFKKLDIVGGYSTAYHPQTDGLTERLNQELKQYLRNYCSYRQDDWSDYLAMAEFAHNNAVNASTKQSPFYANYGYHPKTFLSQVRDSGVPEADNLVNRITRLQDELKAAMRLAQEDIKKYHDRKATEHFELKEGDKVWLDAQNIQTTSPSKTLANQHLGPFTIKKKLSDLTRRTNRCPVAAPHSMSCYAYCWCPVTWHVTCTVSGLWPDVTHLTPCDSQLLCSCIHSHCNSLSSCSISAASLYIFHTLSTSRRLSRSNNSRCANLSLADQCCAPTSFQFGQVRGNLGSSFP